ncbi:MAG: DUF3854 domain-containing protein [Gemmataceae bacterium]
MSTMPNAKLFASHLKSLRARGLTDETIRLARLYSERDPERLQRILHWEGPAKNGDAIVIPFFSSNGEPLTFFRVRWDNPRLRADGTVAKYDSPSGKGQTHIYFPPRAREVKDKPDKPIFVVESEFAAMVADQHGAAAVALGGVSMWSRPRAEGESDERVLHPDLEQVVWKDRVVFIAFDSDTLYKSQPKHEEWAFAQALAGKGARVRIIRIPEKLGGPKVGLDDYLAAAGSNAVAALQKLTRDSQEPAPPAIGFSNSIRRETPDGEEVEVGRSIAEMATELVGTAKGWPRNVGGVLVVPGGKNGIQPIDDANALGAFVHSLFDRCGTSGTTWMKGPTHPTRPELLSYLLAHCEHHDRADSLPHVPPIPGVYYTAAPPTGNDFKALAGFLDFFSPATKTDESLLLAMLMTPFWGGPAGKRPAFLIEGEETDPEAGRGLGKTTVANKIAGLAGGAFEIDASEPFPRTRSRLLTPEAQAYRVLLMDNVKTFRLSSADLESLVTNPFINGHRLYHGQAGVMNYFTLMLTLNGASLSKDVAQRVVTVRLKRAGFRVGWEAELDHFVEKHRQQIIGDIVAMLKRPAAHLDKVSRWGPWETEVLARVENPKACWETIRERASEHDADREDADRIRETLAEVVDRLDSTNAHSRCFLLTSSATTKLVSLSVNNRYVSAAGASATIKALGVKGFKKSDRNGGRFWLWVGDEYPAGGKSPSPSHVLTFDPDPKQNGMGRTVPPEWRWEAAR